MSTILNKYLFGYTVIPVILACKRHNLFTILNLVQPLPFIYLVNELRVKSGYLRVTLNLLESLNWVSRNSKDEYLLTPASDIHRKIPEEVIELISFPMHDYLNKNEHTFRLQKWIALSGQRWDMGDSVVADFLDGLLVIPLLGALIANKFLSMDHWQAPLFSKLNSEVSKEITKFFINQGWLSEEKANNHFTDTGRNIVERMAKTGMANIYRLSPPKIPEIIFGECQSFTDEDQFDYLRHLDYILLEKEDRFEYNRYFSDLEKIILSIFNQKPLDEQPKYIANMGCGDGTLLKKINEIIKDKSLRGKALHEYPIKLIGIDRNHKNLEETARVLKDIDHITLEGSIDAPDRMVTELKNMGIMDPENILHVRSFLDHDRIYTPPLDDSIEHSRPNIPCTAVCVDREGKEILPASVMGSLTEHLKRWASVPGNHGQIISELHYIEPGIICKHIDRFEIPYMDIGHHFSRGLLVGADTFLMAAADVGLFPKRECLKKYPESSPFGRITLGHYERREYRIRFARENDLPALDQLERKCWAPSLQRPVSVLKKRIKKFPEGQLVLETDNRIAGVIYSQRILQVENIKKASMETVEKLHRKEGSIIQLLAINILPEMQHQNLGDQLLEFMLQRCSVMSGIRKIVAVTRCKDYHKHENITPEEYIRFRNEQGRLVDTVLRFHELHGGQIIELIPNYRPQDQENEGYGTLVEYDIWCRQRNDLRVNGGDSEKAGLLTAENQPFIQEFIKKTIILILGKAKEADFSLDRPLMEMGLDSADLLELNEQISYMYRISLEPSFFFKYNTARLIIAYLRKHVDKEVENDVPPAKETVLSIKDVPESTGKPDFSLRKEIAVVGVACRFPGGIKNPEQLWELLIEGRDVIGKVPPHRWNWPDYIDPDNAHRGIDFGGFFDDLSAFDARFFRISPKEAELMDPQQRILLELSWECLEDAGYPVQTVSGGKTGVFIGASGSDYSRLIDCHSGEVDAHYGTGTSMAVLPNRISYFYDFHGPSIQIDTACSSSLVAVHEAVKSLQAGECGLALVGGVNIICHPANSIAYYKAGMLANDGKCKTFDKSANGYVRGEGMVMILLKPLEQALHNQDHIYAVIKGTAINHGGQAGGLTAPNPERQTALLIDAYSDAEIEPETIGYIEAHGTGTSLGDPVEISGLKDAFTQLSKGNGIVQEPYCGLGSIKTNLGHLEAAAGITGLLKVALCMRYQTIPASLNYKELNPYINLDNSPFYIANRLQPWKLPEGQLLRRAGVSSFGSGGANAHVVVEEAPVIGRCLNRQMPCYLICMSAKTEEGLRRKQQDLADWLDAEGEQYSLVDISATLLLARDHFDNRAAYVVGSLAEIRHKLREVLEKGETEAFYKNNKAGKEKTVQPLFEDLGRTILKEFSMGGEISERKYRDQLMVLAELYVKGYDLNWKAIFGDCEIPRISLPSYPFAGEHYWTPKAELPVSPLAQKNSEGKSEALDNHDEEFGELLYLPRWEQQPLQDTGKTHEKPDTVLIVTAGTVHGFEKVIRDYYVDNKIMKQVIQIRLSNATHASSETEWVCDVNDSMGFETCLRGCGPVDCLYFISETQAEIEMFGLDTLAQSQLNNEMQLLRLIKYIKQMEIKKPLDCYILTQDNHRIGDGLVNPLSGGITGLAYSIAQGDHRFLVRNIDISLEDLQTREKQDELFRQILMEEPSDRGEVVKLKAGSRYQQVFVKLAGYPLSYEPGLKQGGVYVILGGAGVIGGIITRCLMREFQAKVVWIGRKPGTSEVIKEKILSLQGLGEPPRYIQADVTDPVQMKQAVTEIKKYYPAINGAIFSGIILNYENSIAKNKESEFLEILNVKTKGSLSFYNVFQDESLDFMCYFSSAQAFSFSGAANLAAYASGITFSDTFVRFLQGKTKFPVGMINWGFWRASVEGISLSKNVGSLENSEGFECFKYFSHLLRGMDLCQIICLKSSKPVRELMKVNEEESVTIYPSSPDSLIRFMRADEKEKEWRIKDYPMGGGNLENFNDWMSRLLFAQMRKVGIFDTNFVSEHVTKLPSKAGIIAKYERWFQECLNILETNGYIQSENGWVKVVDNPEPDNPEKVWNDFESVKDAFLKDPDLEAKVRLVNICLRELPGILRGNLLATDIVFPNSSMALVEIIYKENTRADYFNNVVADMVVKYLSHRIKADSQTKMRIIEAGAGTGGTSKMVFAGLKQFTHCIEYCYTDISKSFLMFAEERYGPDNPFLTYKRWNIEEPLADQGIESGGYDVVIATNVLHATKNIRRTLRNTKAALKTNGILILNEITGKTIFTTLTFGLLDGWWLYEDGRLRIPGSPLLDPEMWQKVLEEEGFRQIYFPAEETRNLDQQIIIAESDGIVRQAVRKEMAGKLVIQENTIDNRRNFNETGWKAPQPAREIDGITGQNEEEYVKTKICDCLAKILKTSLNAIESNVAFSEYGVDSIIGGSFIKQLNDVFGVTMNTAILFDYTNIERLKSYIIKTYSAQIQQRLYLSSVNPSSPKTVNITDSYKNDTEIGKENGGSVQQETEDYEFIKLLEKRFLTGEISADRVISAVLASQREVPNG